MAGRVDYNLYTSRAFVALSAKVDRRIGREKGYYIYKTGVKRVVGCAEAKDSRGTA